jgi:hypothetical protein
MSIPVFYVQKHAGLTHGSFFERRIGEDDNRVLISSLK